MQNSQSPNDNTSKLKMRQILLDGLAILTILLAVLLPRILKLDQFVTPDEEVWILRSANYYMALAQRDFANTYQKEHPGVPIMWAGTAAYLLEYPEYRGSGEGQTNTMRFIYFMDNYSKVAPLEILKTARVYVVLGITLILGLAFIYTRRIIGFLPALLGFLLIAFDPYHLALTRLLHLDGMMSTLLFLSLISFISYLKDRRLVDLIVSGASAGFCWLTKSPGFFLGVAIVLLVLYTMWARRPSDTKWWSWKYLWYWFWPLIAWSAIGWLVYFAFWPAMWVNPIGTISNVLTQAEGYAERGHFSSIFFNGDVIQDGDLGLRYAYFYPLTYLWRTTPVVLAGLIAATWGFFTRRKPFNATTARLTVVGLLIFVALFSLVMTLGLKKFDRYLLPVYLPLDLIAGMGWACLAYWALTFNETRALKAGVYLALGIVIGAQFYFAASSFPYYFSYYNPLMGGSSKAPEVMQIGWGEGMDQAARYLNSKPDADQLDVYAWYSRGCFSYLFDGRTYYVAPTFGEREEDMQNLLSADYAVIYIHQWQRNLPPRLLDYFRDKIPEKSIWIDGIEYARIYKIS